ncbi:LolA family protein [Streptomyces albireticuli]|uniref:LolA family protein n=1 Tax=Streptomyces albireticuli TaxID=1940 RepID=UPI00367A7844
MARNEAHQGNTGSGDPASGIAGARGRRKAVRYAVPVAVAGIAAATIGIGSALASGGDPDLPKISAEELIAKVAKSDVQQMSGSVKFSTDLGLPSLPSGISLGEGGKGGKGQGAEVSPQAKLAELASGTHTLRVAVDGPDKQRLSIVERAAEYSLIRDGDQVWAYDSGSNTVHHSTAPSGKGAKDGKGGRDGKGGAAGETLGASPQELAKKALDAVGDSTSVAVDGTAKVAGRDAYQLTVKPKAAESTVGAVRIAVDAKTGTPLKFTLAAKSGGKPVVDAAFTKVDFGKPSASTFDFTPPKGAKVTEDKDLEGRAEHRAEGMPGLPGLSGGSGAPGLDVLGKDWASIAHFTVPKDLGEDAGKAAEKAGGAGKSAPAGGLFEKFGSKVSGSFGSGQIFSTRLVNALITDNGDVYVGAVTKDALIAAAK